MNRWFILSSSKGFTITELLVSLGIITLIVGILIGNYPKVNARSSLNRLAREMALTVREAQVFGLAVREFPRVSGQVGEFPPYGVYLNRNPSSGLGRQVILFADLSSSENRIYDEGSGCGNSDTECLARTDMTGAEVISDICLMRNKSAGFICGFDEVNITFRRPDPEAIIVTDGSTDYNAAEIKLTSLALPNEEKVIRVWLTGQISVQ